MKPWLFVESNLVGILVIFVGTPAKGFTTPLSFTHLSTATYAQLWEGSFKDVKKGGMTGNRIKIFMEDPVSSTEDSSSGSTKEEIRNEVNEALTSVGWSPPLGDGELTSEDPFVAKIDAQIQKDFGVGLDELLNPAKVVNLERDLYNLRSELATMTGLGEIDVLSMTTPECDGGGGGDNADKIRDIIQKKENTLLVERRAVFRGWLKNVFLGQAILSLGLSWVMVTNPAQLFGGFDWFATLNLDISIRALGFWWWWLFIVPSLRSRRPNGPEKKALDIAFIGTPLISILAPVATKDTAIIWLLNFGVVAGSYGFAFATDGNEDDDNAGGGGGPEWLKFIYRSLDVGGGRERGIRK